MYTVQDIAESEKIYRELRKCLFVFAGGGIGSSKSTSFFIHCHSNPQQGAMVVIPAVSMLCWNVCM